MDFFGGKPQGWIIRPGGFSKKGSVIPFAVFRVDASPRLGGGHVYRCLALADALAQAGWKCAFSCTSQTLEMMSCLTDSTHDVFVLESFGPGEPEAMIHHWPDGCCMLVVDHYQKGRIFENKLKGWAAKILVIDDLANREHACDILIDATLGREASDYAVLVPEDGIVLVGPRYAPMRSQFSSARERARSHRKEYTSINRILVSMGASDPHGVTEKVLEGISIWRSNVMVDVVLGPGSEFVQAGKTHRNIHVHQSVRNMAALMAPVDLAIGAAGTASWERCCLGLPTLLIITADNQKKVALELERAGAAITIGVHDKIDPVDIAKAIQKLSGNASDYHRMAQSAAAVCDGLGSERIQLAILPQKTARNGKVVSLKRVAIEDLDLMYRWQSNPLIRKFSRQELPFAYDEHVAWVKSSLENSRRSMYLIQQAHKPVGILRFDELEEFNKFEISILIDADYQGLGIASVALSLGRSLRPSGSFLAYVRPGNNASRKLFKGAGYYSVDETHFLSKPMQH